MPQPARRPARAEVARLIRVLAASLALLIAAPALTADADPDLDLMHPLLQYARERERTRDRKPRPPPSGVAELKEAQHQLSQSNPPKPGECAGSLGAARAAADAVLELAARELLPGEDGESAVVMEDVEPEAVSVEVDRLLCVPHGESGDRLRKLHQRRTSW